MSEETNQDRRRLLGTAVLTIAAAELAMIGSADAQSPKINPIKPGTNTSFSALKQIDAGVLRKYSIGAALTVLMRRRSAMA